MWTKYQKVIIDIGILCLLSAFFLFFRLGSMDVPETEQILTSGGEQEIVVDLGQDVWIQDIMIYLGALDHRRLAVSSYDMENREWILLKEDIELNTPYDWNRIELDEFVHYLGIVATSENETYLEEMVILAQDGSKIVPVDAHKYPFLFDEQDKYPTYHTYYEGSMFDEQYYNASSADFLQGRDMSEYTHPPLGKIILSLGNLVFGMTPFGWRFMCVVFGILLLIPVYLLLYGMTGRRKYALMAAIILDLDCMHYTLSRIGTIDSIVALFILTMFCVMFYLQRFSSREILAGQERPSGKVNGLIVFGGLITGCGIATKWTGIYAAAGTAVLFLGYVIYVGVSYKEMDNRRSYLTELFLKTGVCYFVSTIVIYILSYIPMSRAKDMNLLKALWDNNKFMLGFHATITDPHTYQSNWYTWPFDWVPLLDEYTALEDSKVSIVTTMGNPVIWWIGLVAVLFLVYRGIRYKDKKAGYLCFMYFCMYVPWMFIIRTVFIYQYYVCSIVLAMMLAYSLYYIEQTWEEAGIVFISLALFGFILFYPIVSGVATKWDTVAHYMKWFDSWKFIIV